jgi:hypothetical protein
LHVLVDGSPTEIKVFLGKQAITLTAAALPEKEFFGGEDRHEIEAYVSDSEIRQKWVVVPARGAVLVETAGSREGLPLRIDLTPDSQTPTVWNGEVSAEVDVVGTVKPANRLAKLIVANAEQPVDPTLAELRFSAKVNITRDTPDIAVEAFDTDGKYTRIILPVYKQGRRAR